MLTSLPKDSSVFKDGDSVISKYSPKKNKFLKIYIKIVRLTNNHLFNLCSEKTFFSDELVQAVDFLEAGATPKEIVNFSRWILVISFLLIIAGGLALSYFGLLSLIIGIFLFLLPFVFSYLAISYIKSEAKFERMKSLSEIPLFVTHLVILLKKNPNLERALLFVSKFLDGKIGCDVKKIFWKGAIGHKNDMKKELVALGERWSEHFDDFKRSIYLIVSSLGEKSEAKRSLSLDKAAGISLEGSLAKVEDYSSKLYIPTLFLFTFGTILPLVIISLLPLFSFFGKGAVSIFNIFFILIFSLLVIFVYSNKISSMRPSGFSFASIPHLQNDKIKISFFGRSFEVSGWAYSLGIFLSISAPGIFYLLSLFSWVNISFIFFKEFFERINTLSIVWGFGAAIAVYCYGSSWGIIKTRNETEKIDRESIDGAYQLGLKISEGRSPESAVRITGERMRNNSFGKFMKKIYESMKNSHMHIEEIVFDKRFGVMNGVFSRNFKLVMWIFVNSLKKGAKGCSESLFMVSEHLEGLRKAEEKMKALLKNSISMMKITASIFAPMITGLVITLQQMIQKGMEQTRSSIELSGSEFSTLSFLESPNFNFEILQLIGGVYMLLLAVLLIRYAVLLEHGKDEIIIRCEIGKNLPIALFIFTFTLVISRVLMF